jgi:hypothetical protein
MPLTPKEKDLRNVVAAQACGAAHTNVRRSSVNMHDRRQSLLNTAAGSRCDRHDSRQVRPATAITDEEATMSKQAQIRRIGPRLIAAAAIFLPLAATPAAGASWDRAHANGANHGFFDVETRPAGSGSVSIPNIGTFAPGAGPVIGADGTVYIGNEQGTLHAFHPDGSPAWHRDLPAGHAIKASPVVSANGSIFVISVAHAGSRTTDHRTNPPTIVDTRRTEATLHRFLPGGAYPGPIPFPEQYGTVTGFKSRGNTTAPLNVVKSGDIEAVVVPVSYKAPGGHDLRLIAFATNSGAILHDVRVTHVSDTITGSQDRCDIFIFSIGCSFDHGVNDELAAITPPHPGAAIFTFAGGGHPWVLVSDGKALVGYTFSPEGKFTERIRGSDDPRGLTSPPVALPDGHTVIGTADGRVIFAGPSQAALPPVTGLGAVFAAPTRTGDGRLVVVKRGESAGDGGFAVLNQNQVLLRKALPGQSIASAAASRNHVFIATTNAFLTFDAVTMEAVKEFPWTRGGLWPPVVGPRGHVYAMASNVLFVFPPPAHACPECATPPGGVHQ